VSLSPEYRTSSIQLPQQVGARHRRLRSDQAADLGRRNGTAQTLRVSPGPIFMGPGAQAQSKTYSPKSGPAIQRALQTASLVVGERQLGWRPTRCAGWRNQV